MKLPNKSVLAVIAVASLLMVAAVTTVNLATQVFGLLPVANGGTGVSTATANYLFAGPTSGSAAAPAFRAQVAADAPTITSTVGLDGIWITSVPFSSGPVLPNTNVVTPVNSTMYFTQLELLRSEVIGHATGDVTTAGTAETLYVCLYDSSGSSLLWSASGADTSTGAFSFSASQYTAPPGLYLLGYEQTGTGAAALLAMTAAAPGTYATAVLNKNGNRLGTAGNTVSGSACPTTLGTLTAAAEDLPAIALEP